MPFSSFLSKTCGIGSDLHCKIYDNTLLPVWIWVPWFKKKKNPEGLLVKLDNNMKKIEPNIVNI